MVTLSEFSERFAATPDIYRGRASAAAGLLTTATAALAAGVLFKANSATPVVASASALIAVFLLLVSVVFYTAAGLYSRRTTDLSTDELIKSIVGSILLRMRIAAIAALSAAVAVVVLVFSLVQETREMRSVTLMLRSSSADDLASCTKGGRSSIAGHVSSDQLNGGTPYIRIEVPAGGCGDSDRTILISRNDVALIAED